MESMVIKPNSWDGDAFKFIFICIFHSEKNLVSV
jgi:hypothetical protein